MTNEGLWTCVGLAVTGAVAFLWHRRASLQAAARMTERELSRQADQFREQVADLNAKLDAAQRRTDEAQAELRRAREGAAEARASLAAEQKRVQDMERHYQGVLSTMKSEFRALSDDILKEKRDQFEKEGLAGVAKFTGSLLQEVQAFRKRVDEVNADDVARTTALRENIASLLRQTSLVSEQADRLATAIRSEAQVTGQWGEIQLKRVLELGGLQPTIDYDYQETFASPGSDRADLRVDVLVKMPEDRWLVIDAKTTMAAYVDYAGGADGSRDAEALSRIVSSLVEHVKEMKTAGYHRRLAATTGKRILNTMLMYIPFEEVYLVAMKAEIDAPGGRIPLRDWAWQNDVVFVNASGLIPMVRMLAELWARDRSEKKVLQIKEAAEALVEKFNTFLRGAAGRKDGFLSVGACLAAAVAAYNESVRRLADGRGSVLKRLADLKEMGVSTADRLPPPEQVATRQVEAKVLETA